MKRSLYPIRAGAVAAVVLAASVLAGCSAPATPEQAAQKMASDAANAYVSADVDAVRKLVCSDVPYLSDLETVVSRDSVSVKGLKDGIQISDPVKITADNAASSDDGNVLDLVRAHPEANFDYVKATFSNAKHLKMVVRQSGDSSCIAEIPNLGG